MIVTMIVTNIREAKAKLSEYLEAVAQGERVLICKRNRPVAELRAVPASRESPRPIGGAKDRLYVPASFFEPLPEDVLETFEERPQYKAHRVAERPPTDRGGTGRSKGPR
jgi:prevent-host-death family protein